MHKRELCYTVRSASGSGLHLDTNPDFTRKRCEKKKIQKPLPGTVSTIEMSNTRGKQVTVVYDFFPYFPPSTLQRDWARKYYWVGPFDSQLTGKILLFYSVMIQAAKFEPSGA